MNVSHFKIASPFRPLLIVLLLFVCAVPVWAASGEVQFLSYDFDKIVKGEKSLCMHFRVKVSGLKGEDIKVNAYIESPKGVGLPARKGKYSTPKGKVVVSKTLHSPYRVSEWKNVTLTIPNSEIKTLSGRNTYYVEVLVRYKGKTLARTYCKPFTMNGGSKPSPTPKPKPSDHGHKHSHYQPVKTWIENSSRYGFVEVSKYSNGNIKREYYARCPNCQGTSLCGSCLGSGFCGSCNGQGGRYLRELGYWNPCTLCNGTGLCHMCEGNKGKCSLCNSKHSHKHPGYVCNATQIVFPNGMSFSDKVGYQWVSDDWKMKHDKKGSGTCSYCGGTGINPRPTSGQPTGAWIADFVESDEICPICHKAGPHWHDKCSHCNIPTHN